MKSEFWFIAENIKGRISSRNNWKKKIEQRASITGKQHSIRFVGKSCVFNKFCYLYFLFQKLNHKQSLLLNSIKWPSNLSSNLFQIKLSSRRTWSSSSRSTFWSTTWSFISRVVKGCWDGEYVITQMSEGFNWEDTFLLKNLKLKKGGTLGCSTWLCSIKSYFDSGLCSTSKDRSFFNLSRNWN